MRTGDFSEPRRMSGSAYWVLFAKGLKEYASLFVILIVLKFIDADDQHTFMEKMRAVSLLSAGYLALAALTAFISWYFKKYYIEGGKLIFMHGLLSKETTSIPLSKVQSMRTKQGFIYRVLEMRGVLFDTLASKSAEIELILDDRDWKALMERVEVEEEAVPSAAVSASSELPDSSELSGASGTSRFSGAAEERTSGSSLSFSNFNLIKGAFCQNHLQGMAVLFAALAAVYNSVTTVDDHAVDHIIDYVDTHAGTLSLQPSGYVVVAVALYFFVMLLWIGKVFLRYANMARGQLNFESGLIARNSSRFSYDKVCTVYVKRNFLEQWLHGSTVMLRQALNATDEKKGADVRVYGSDSAADFLSWWLGSGYGSSPDVISARSGYGLMWHVMRLDILISLAAAVTLACFGLYVWLAVPAAWLLISLAKGLMAVRRSRITLKEDYIVEVVRLRSTPFTPYSRRVSLTLSTNGTSFTLRSLRIEEAREIYELLLCNCAGRPS